MEELIKWSSRKTEESTTQWLNLLLKIVFIGQLKAEYMLFHLHTYTMVGGLWPVRNHEVIMDK